MPIIEILTDAGGYRVSLDAILIPGQKYSLTELWHLASQIIAKGEPFIGENEVLSIGPGAQIKHIRVLKEAPAGEVKPTPDINSHQESYVTPFDKHVEYLGQELQVSGIEYRHKDQVYILPFTVNGMPALDQLDPKNLQAVVERFAVPWENYEIVIPPGNLASLEEAEEYIEDLIKCYEESVPREPAEMTARAVFLDERIPKIKK